MKEAESVRWVRLLALVGASLVVLVLLGAPTPPLFAGLLGALVVALTTTEPPTLHVAWFRLAQSIIGVSVAAQIDPEVLPAVGVDIVPITVSILVTIAVSVGIGQLLRRHHVSAVTATFSTVAGGASGMVALAEDYGADARIVLVNQYLRVLFILLTLPIVVTVVFTASSADVDGANGPGLWAGGLADYAFVALALALGNAGGRLLRLPAPALLGRWRPGWP
ncbi:AbrB family transcriptional regulator [Nocardioides panacisoli]|nr:AbrB family transcriptional regulator [Nocardioides panacisoli]